MKRPGWLGGHGGPDPEEDPGDVDRERARRERLRAQRRLAAKASGEAVEEESPRRRPAAKAKAESPKPDRRKPEKVKGERPKGDEPKRKPAEKALPALGKDRATARRGKPRSGSPRSRSAKEGRGIGSALKQGVKATRSSTKGVPSRAGRGALAALGAVFAIFFDVLAFVLNVLIWIVGKLAGPARAVINGLGGLVRVASAVATPTRVLTVVVAGAAILLALSQFADYRSVTVGTDAYAEVETVAPAPEKERDETGSAHSYLMVPLAAASLLLLGAAVAGRRWRLCRVIAAAGGVAMLVSLVIDRPAGLDPGDLELAFDGVRATLLGGFYAQLFSGLLLTTASLMLGRELRLAGAAKPARSSPSGSRRRTLRRPPKAEGARA